MIFFPKNLVVNDQPRCCRHFKWLMPRAVPTLGSEAQGEKGGWQGPEGAAQQSLLPFPRLTLHRRRSLAGCSSPTSEGAAPKWPKMDFCASYPPVLFSA